MPLDADQELRTVEVLEKVELDGDRQEGTAPPAKKQAKRPKAPAAKKPKAPAAKKAKAPAKKAKAPAKKPKAPATRKGKP